MGEGKYRHKNFIQCLILLRHEISSLDYSETMQFAFIGHGYTKMGRISRYGATCMTSNILPIISLC